MASLIELISPKWAANRERARLQLARSRYVGQKLNEIRSTSRRSYEGASTGRRTQGWLATDQGPAGATPFILATLRDRSQWFAKNNPFFGRAVRGIATNTVGDGIQAKVDGSVRRLRGPAPDELWRAWAESTDCDADGRNNLYGLQDLIMRTVVTSGEVLVRRRRRRAEDGLSVPVQMQVLEPEMLADDVFGGVRKSKGTIRAGIEFNRRGKRVAYHLYKAHPKTQAGSTLARFDTVRVPAEDILHIYRVDRPGQIRGVPWAAPIMNRLKQLDDYEDAALERARVAACFSAFIVEPDAVGLPDATDGDGNEVDFLERVEPGMIEHLTPGRDVRFGTPPSTSDYPEFVRANLRAIASGLDMPYEILGDLSQVNFSSARMGWLEFQRAIESYRWQMLIPGFCEPAFAWFAEAAKLALGVDASAIQWTAPRAQMVDPAKEIGAIKDAVRCGLMTWAEAVREQGYDPDEVLDEIADYNAKADELGVVLDTDPRSMSKAGQTQQDAADEGDDNESDDNADEENDETDESADAAE